MQYIYGIKTNMLSKTKKSFTLIFALVLFLELICGSIDSLSQLHYVTKPLVLVSLIIFFLKHNQHLNSKTKTVMLFALLFSLLGDVLLMFVENSTNFFIGGLVAFLLAHVMYILVFLKKRNSTKLSMLFVFLLFIYAFGLFYVLKDSLGDMLIPVIAYMLVILSMVISATLRKNSVSKTSYGLVFIGALFFMISDSVLAINKFYNPIPLSNIIIMLTYAIAQYLIIVGVLREKD